MIAACSGGAGDIVYSIPTMQQLGIKTLYVKAGHYHGDYGTQQTFVKSFVELHGIQCLPTSPLYPFHHYDPNLRYDIDLDASRNQPRRGHTHILKSFANHFRTRMPNVHAPWLNIEGHKLIEEDYSLICLTPRWRDESKVDWEKVVRSIEGNVYFIGFDIDYTTYCRETKWVIPWYKTTTLLEMAILVRDCKTLYTNQNVSLTLAQGLFKPYFLESKPGRTNTILRTRNETLIDKTFWYDKV